MTTGRRLAFALLAVGLAITACGGDDGDEAGASEGGGAIVVGSANFAESTIVASMYAQVLEHEGYDVVERFDIGAREVYFDQLEQGSLDLVPEFVGSLTAYLDGTGHPDTATAVRELESLLPDGLTLLAPAPAQSKNALVVTAATAAEHGLATVSDLVGKELTLGGPPECPTRPLCMAGFQATYGLDFTDRFIPLDVAGPISREALARGDVDVAVLFSTDPGIRKNGWVVLEDDEQLQPAENVIPVIRADVLDDELTRLLDAVSAELNDDDYVDLLTLVYVDGEDEAAVATGWLEEHGFLD